MLVGRTFTCFERCSGANSQGEQGKQGRRQLEPRQVGEMTIERAGAQVG